MIGSTAPPQAVLPLDAAAAVDDPLQERLQQELRAGLGVREAPLPVLGVLAEERLEVGQQGVHVQAAAGVHVPGGVLEQACLCRVGQLARDDLGIDRICHVRRVVAGDQPQVADVLEIGGLEPVLASAACRVRPS